MKVDIVKTWKPIKRWLYWIEEREQIRHFKDVGAEKPWTDDEILRDYRFCNVRRMDDKVSQWLLENWYKPYKDHKFALVNCALARFINRPESLTAITSICYQTGRLPEWRPDRIVSRLRELRDGGNTIFNGAYMVRGNDGIDKIDCVTNYYVKPLLAIEPIPSSMERTWNAILPSFGMGSFMAGQIVADLRHAVSGRWGDRNIWAPMGPGSLRGMNRLLERPLKAPMKQEEFLTELTKLRAIGLKHLPPSISERLEAIDWQNTLCEFDKYCRALLGEGKPKQKYPGRASHE